MPTPLYIQILIGGTDRSKFLQISSGMNISLRLYESGTAQFTLYDPAQSYVPLVGQEATVFIDGAGYLRGSVDEVSSTRYGTKADAHVKHQVTMVSLESRLVNRLIRPFFAPNPPQYMFKSRAGEVSASGGTSILWKRGDKFSDDMVGDTIVIGGTSCVVTAFVDRESITVTPAPAFSTGVAYTSTKKAGNIVKYIRTHWLNGDNITAGTIDDGADITKVVFDSVTVQEALDQLATASGFVRYISSAGALNFTARTATPAPFTIDDLTTSVQKLSVRTTREDYRNVQYLKFSFAALSPEIATFTGNGVKRSFSVPAAIDSVAKISVNGVEQTVGIQGGDTNQWYFDPGDLEVYQDAAEPTLDFGAALEVQYNPAGFNIAEQKDTAEITARATAENNSGNYQRILDQPNNTSADSVDQIAAATLNAFKEFNELVTVETREPGLYPGQALTVNTTDPDISGVFIITALEMRLIGQDSFAYTATAAKGPIIPPTVILGNNTASGSISGIASSGGSSGLTTGVISY